MKKLLLIVALALTATFSSAGKADAFYVPQFDFSNLFKGYFKTEKLEKISVDTSFDKNNNEVEIVFSKLEDAEVISFELTYFSNKQYEGVTGDIVVNGESKINRTIFLGTCSNYGNCTPHENVKWMMLKVDTLYSNEKTETRVYHIK